MSAKEIFALESALDSYTVFPPAEQRQKTEKESERQRGDDTLVRRERSAMLGAAE